MKKEVEGKNKGLAWPLTLTCRSYSLQETLAAAEGTQ